MALADVLNRTQKRKKIGVSEERIKAVLPIVRKYIALWREYQTYLWILWQAQIPLFICFFISVYFCGQLYDINICMQSIRARTLNPSSQYQP